MSVQVNERASAWTLAERQRPGPFCPRGMTSLWPRVALDRGIACRPSASSSSIRRRALAERPSRVPLGSGAGALAPRWPWTAPGHRGATWRVTGSSLTTRFVLAVGSAVFDAMFNGGMATTSTEIELPDVEPAAFLALLK